MSGSKFDLSRGLDCPVAEVGAVIETANNAKAKRRPGINERAIFI